MLANALYPDIRTHKLCLIVSIRARLCLSVSGCAMFSPKKEL
jgi:hypothetical protein